ncbi:putative phenylalanine--tRNA ligase [Helianthus anomalus]
MGFNASRYILPFGVEKPFEAKRYYSIDRVFRNVAVDRTHLAEFHQIEGISVSICYCIQ